MKTQKNPQDFNVRDSKDRNPWRAAAVAPGSQKRKLPLLIALGGLLLFAASSAQATMMITAIESSGNVVFTLSGSVNTLALGAFNSGVTNSVDFGGVDPHFGAVTMEPGDIAGSFFQLNSFVGTPQLPFGNGTFTRAQTLSVPDFFSFEAVGGFLGIASNYVNGSQLNDSITFSNQTFLSLGIQQGTYLYSWSNGNAKDSLTLQLGPAKTVPDTGPTLMLMGLGLTSLGFLRHTKGLKPTRIHNT